MQEFTHKIYKWYHKNKRDLPWRLSTDPYKIWISEIILQQTRVAQGTSYFNRFIDCFPDINKLANASENEVLKQWQGLGYYSRARNIHFSAKKIVNDNNGVFPSDYKSILSLKGIGPYTAAAISSIAFNQSYPAIDGNVSRVISRYFGITAPIDSTNAKKDVEIIAREIMPEKDPGMHNQALMEFGAIICISQSPKCNECPVFAGCYARLNKIQNKIPLKEKRTKQKNRYFTYFYVDDGEFTYIEKRNSDDIWKNLYQFPLYETSKDVRISEIVHSNYYKNILKKPEFIYISDIKKHILSHQIIYAKMVKVKNKPQIHLNRPFLRINKKDIFTFAVPKLLENFIEEFNDK